MPRVVLEHSPAHDVGAPIRRRRIDDEELAPAGRVNSALPTTRAEPSTLERPGSRPRGNMPSRHLHAVSQWICALYMKPRDKLANPNPKPEYRTIGAHSESSGLLPIRRLEDVHLRHFLKRSKSRRWSCRFLSIHCQGKGEGQGRISLYDQIFDPVESADCRLLFQVKIQLGRL